ncbi:MAG: hypothetical protein QNJ97_00370 [Myxococcota bacterium]|nr:hypothetical protein [Myxococcota bacterium]
MNMAAPVPIYISIGVVSGSAESAGDAAKKRVADMTIDTVSGLMFFILISFVRQELDIEIASYKNNARSKIKFVTKMAKARDTEMTVGLLYKTHNSVKVSSPINVYIQIGLAGSDRGGTITMLVLKHNA